MKHKLYFSLVLGVLLFGATASVRAEIFFAYLEGRQEVPAAATTGKGYARVFVNETAMTYSFTVVFNGLTSAQTLSHIHAPAAIGANAPVIINFGTVGGTSGTISGSGSITAGQLAQLRAKQGYVNVHSSNFPNGELRGQLGPKRPVDFDGDGRQDYSVLRFPAAGDPRPITYWNLNSTTGQQTTGPWGNALTDFPVPGDYDGDGLDDMAVFRVNTAGAQSDFYVFRSATGTPTHFAWGRAGDQAVCRDYDGDGKTDFAVTRRGAFTSDPLVWYIRNSTNNADRVVNFGLSGSTTTAFDAPVPADYDGDGKYDLAVYRFNLPPMNHYIYQQSSDSSIKWVQWGDFNSDYILPGDYDGDGKADFAAAKTGATGTSPMVWWILRSSGGFSVTQFGFTNDLPVQGDYDGDSRTDLALAREGGAAVQTVFWTLNSFDNATSTINWGLGADFPVATFDAR